MYENYGWKYILTAAITINGFVWIALAVWRALSGSPLPALRDE